MPLYESTFIARHEMSTQQVEGLATTFAAIIEENGGQVGKTEHWGLRNLAYRIKKNRKGHYVFFNIDAASEAVQEYERNMRLNEDVLRYLTVRVDELDPEPSSMMQSRSPRDDRSRRGGAHPGRSRSPSADADQADKPAAVSDGVAEDRPASAEPAPKAKAESEGAAEKVDAEPKPKTKTKAKDVPSDSDAAAAAEPEKKAKAKTAAKKKSETTEAEDEPEKKAKPKAAAKAKTETKAKATAKDKAKPKTTKAKADVDEADKAKAPAKTKAKAAKKTKSDSGDET